MVSLFCVLVHMYLCVLWYLYMYKHLKFDSLSCYICWTCIQLDFVLLRCLLHKWFRLKARSACTRTFTISAVCWSDKDHWEALLRSILVHLVDSEKLNPMRHCHSLVPTLSFQVPYLLSLCLCVRLLHRYAHTYTHTHSFITWTYLSSHMILPDLYSKDPFSDMYGGYCNFAQWTFISTPPFVK